MKHFCRRCTALVLALMLLTGCFSYMDMNRLLFITMSLWDADKDDGFTFYAEAFKAYRGEGEKAGREKRMMLFGQGKSVSEAAEQLRNETNYPAEYAGSKIFVMTRKVAERGMGDLLDLTNRDQKPSLRNYLLVLDGDARAFTNIVMEEEQFMGLYLYQLMNSQDRTLGIIDCQMYTFLERLNNPSCINVVPIIKFTTIQAQVGTPSGAQSAGEQSSSHSSREGGGSGGSDSVPTLQQPYVYIDGAAVFIKTQMKTQLSTRELEVYKLLTGKVHAGLLTAPNPDAEGKLLGFSTLKNKFHSSATLEGDQVRLSLQLDLRVALLEAQQTFNATPETIEQSRQNLHDVVSTRISELFERMRDENIDLFEIRKMMEDQYIFTLPEDFLKNTELDLTVNIIMDSLGTLKSSYY